jgi:hypothetical protein
MALEDRSADYLKGAFRASEQKAESYAADWLEELTDAVGEAGSEVSVSWDDVEDKPSEFPPASHEHSAADITSGTLNIARIPTGTSSSTVSLGNHSHTGLMTGSASAVADSSEETSPTTAEFNALLAALRSRGVIS